MLEYQRRRTRPQEPQLDDFVLLKLLSYAVLPPASLLVGGFAGIALALGGWRLSGATVAGLAFLQTLFLALPPVADVLMAPLERSARSLAAEAKPCCYAAIVVLGKGVVPEMPPGIPSPHLVDGADRIFHAARLFHAGVAPRIIASGGRPRVEGARQSEAEAMQQLLIDLGVPANAISLETRSANTIENIEFVRELAGSEPVALVTSAYHMPRALRIARARNLKASAFPTDWHLGLKHRAVWQNFLPTFDAGRASEYALREYAAALFDWREGQRLH